MPTQMSQGGGNTKKIIKISDELFKKAKDPRERRGGGDDDYDDQDGGGDEDHDAEFFM